MMEGHSRSYNKPAVILSGLGDPAFVSSRGSSPVQGLQQVPPSPDRQVGVDPEWQLEPLGNILPWEIGVQPQQEVGIVERRVVEDMQLVHQEVVCLPA